MSFNKGGLKGKLTHGFCDRCLDGGIKAYSTPGSHLICNAYVPLPCGY